jgi:hypothetical protein
MAYGAAWTVVERVERVVSIVGAEGVERPAATCRRERVTLLWFFFSSSFFLPKLLGFGYLAAWTMETVYRAMEGVCPWHS